MKEIPGCCFRAFHLIIFISYLTFSIYKMGCSLSYVQRFLRVLIEWWFVDKLSSSLTCLFHCMLTSQSSWKFHLRLQSLLPWTFKKSSNSFLVSFPSWLTSLRAKTASTWGRVRSQSLSEVINPFGGELLLPPKLSLACHGSWSMSETLAKICPQDLISKGIQRDFST